MLPSKSSTYATLKSSTYPLSSFWPDAFFYLLAQYNNYYNYKGIRLYDLLAIVSAYIIESDKD